MLQTINATELTRKFATFVGMSQSQSTLLWMKPGSHMKVVVYATIPLWKFPSSGFYVTNQFKKVDIVKKHPVSKLHHSTISSKKKSRKARSKCASKIFIWSWWLVNYCNFRSTAKMLSRDLSFSQELPFTVGSSTSQSFSIPVNYQEVLAKQPTPGERGISSSVSDDHWCHCQDWSCIERGLKQVHQVALLPMPYCRLDGSSSLIGDWSSRFNKKWGWEIVCYVHKTINADSLWAPLP